MSIEVRYFRMCGADGTTPANRILFGEVVEETETHYRVKGMYLVFSNHKLEQTEADVVPSTAAAHIEPFSPVGSQVQTITFQKTRIEAEYHDMPPQFAHMMMSVYNGERRNAELRDKLLSMPTPTRSAATPEEALSKLAKYIDSEGKLPDTEGAGDVSFHMPMGIEAGSFKTVELSPYREQTDG